MAAGARHAPLGAKVVVWAGVCACLDLLPRAGATVQVEDWFLTGVEIKAEAVGRDRSRTVSGYPGIMPYTAGNDVTFLPDGASFFASLKADVDNAGSGDQILGAGWTLSPDLEMTPETAPAAAGSGELGALYDCVTSADLGDACSKFGLSWECTLSLADSRPPMTAADANHACCATTASGIDDPSCNSVAAVFSRANARGAEVNLMIWANSFADLDGGTYLAYGQEKMNRLFQDVAASTSVMVLDDRTHDPAKQTTDAPRSIHPKHWSFINSAGVATVSYAGGIDLSSCRYDNADLQRRLRGGRSLMLDAGCGGWLDQSLRIEGPAAADIANSFVQRWNWKADLKHPQERGDSSKFSSQWQDKQLRAAVQREIAGGQYVQVLRTIPCDTALPFMECGEFTILAALLKAIAKAEKYIFIEDQYGFHVEMIKEALSQALSRGVLVLVVLNSIGAGYGNAFCGGNTEDMWQDLRNQGALVLEYNKEDFGDFVHSKTWVVDDCWFMTGSANLNLRSMTSDQELSVAVMEDTCDGWVKNARCSLWAELTDATKDYVCGLDVSSASSVRASVTEIFGTSGENTAKLQPMVLGATGPLEWSCYFLDDDSRCKVNGVCDYDAAFGSEFCDATTGDQEYAFAVTTADELWAGTDAKVDVRIWGSEGSTGWVRLKTLLSASANPFEQGAVNNFNIRSCGLGSLQRFEIDTYSFDFLDAWKPSRFELPGCGTLTYSQWIEEDAHNRLSKVSYDCAAPVWSDWSSWGSWSYTCSQGTRTRQRSCIRGGLDCGTDTQTQTAAVPACTWSTSAWSECSQDCGGGTRTATRTCSVHGVVCESETLTEACNRDACEVYETGCSLTPSCRSGFEESGGAWCSRRRYWRSWEQKLTCEETP